MKCSVRCMVDGMTKVVIINVLAVKLIVVVKSNRYTSEVTSACVERM